MSALLVDEATDYVYNYVEDDTCRKCGRRDALSRLSLFRADSNKLDNNRARSVCAHIAALLSGASCQDSVNYRCCKSCQLLVQVFSTIILVPIVHRISRTLFLYRAT